MNDRRCPLFFLPFVFLLFVVPPVSSRLNCLVGNRQQKQKQQGVAIVLYLLFFLPSPPLVFLPVVATCLFLGFRLFFVDLYHVGLK